MSSAAAWRETAEDMRHDDTNLEDGLVALLLMTSSRRQHTIASHHDDTNLEAGLAALLLMTPPCRQRTLVMSS